MKKLLSVFLSLSIILGLIASVNVFATEDITVELDGNAITFDVNPQIIDGRTMVPLRKIFEEIGALVKWNGETKTVSARKNSKTITLSVDSDNLQIDKGKTDDEGNPIIENVTLDVPAQIVSDRTLVPIRAISESFGLNVSWDEDNRKVVIASDEEEDASWEENVVTLNLDDLTFKGEGIEISDNQIKITSGGDFTLKGTLDDGNIVVSTKEKVKLRLDGVKITSNENPCIFVEEADKVYITVSENTENNLVAKNSEDGAIYSKENLEIKGKGKLNIESLAGHGIKASDNLNIENGIITINATSDGIHINDTFKMVGGEVNIAAVGDGIDSESIVNIKEGIINIETNGVPLETAQTEESTANQPMRHGMWEETQDVEFEKSTKGINAEWMICISDGEININSASHAIHCQDEIEINGGKFNLSSKYDKGISAHGNLTVNGENTIIDVTKSTEGIESKNVMTVNDGIIKVVSTDDAINATGGNSGMMMPGGNFGGNGEWADRMPPVGFERPVREPVSGQTDENAETQTEQGTRPQRGGKGGFMPPFEMPEGAEFMPPFEMVEGEFMPPFKMPEGTEFTPTDGVIPQGEAAEIPKGFMGGNRKNMKNCLIINGGYFELCGSDDCIDANGNMIINGGIIKAANPTGSFSGNFGVIDPDGQITVSENVTLVLAANGGSERSLELTQNSITVYFEKSHGANEKVTVSDKNGNVVYEYAPTGSFKAVLIASNNIKTGETYIISVGEESFETEIVQKSTVIGTQTGNGIGFGRGERMW